MKKLIICLGFLGFFFSSPCVYAQSYNATYRFEFYPRSDGSVDADLSISLDNTQSDTYINQFTISIPNNFFSEKLIASIDTDGIDYKVDSSKAGKRLIFTFDEPSKLMTSHLIKLKYTNENVFLKNPDGVDEIILPLIKTDDTAKVSVLLHLPTHENKVVSLIKPKASVVQQKVIEWKNVKEDTLYVQLGSYNIYSSRLKYVLSNPELRPVTKSVTLPPDTSYQKVFLDNISPKPSKVNTDEDGNYLAYYNLAPRTKINVTFDGHIQVFSRSRSDNINIIRSQIQKQKIYLTTEQKLWSLGSFSSNEDIKKLYSPKEIYDYITREFVYNRTRLKTSPERRGAFESLQDTLNSICTDFTDTFIAVAREKGILSREIEGYAYSQRNDFRPLSLNADVLHSWPEYYDSEREVWIPIDPTWGQTSGINYFDAFDVMHVALAIHGKNAESPVPAGIDKVNEFKAVLIKPTRKLPSDKRSIDLSNTIPDKIVALKKYHSKLLITNASNVFLYNLDLTPTSDGISFDQSTLHVDAIAPLETKTVDLYYKTLSNNEGIGSISFLYDGKKISSKTIIIQNQETYTIQIVLGIAIGIIILTGSYFIVKYRR